MKHFFRVFLCSALTFVVSATSYATNVNFLSNTAMSNFTQEDWAIFNSTQQKVLNSGKANVTVEWKNPNSGSHGTMTPSAETRQNGMVCRKLAVVNVARLVKGEGAYTFCKVNNEWKIY